MNLQGDLLTMLLLLLLLPGQQALGVRPPGLVNHGQQSQGVRPPRVE